MGGSSSSEEQHGDATQNRELTRGEKYVEAQIAKLENGGGTALDILDQAIRDDGAAWIGSYLEKPECKCEKLWLRRNCLTSLGVAKLAKSIGCNATLKDLAIIENKMGEQLSGGEENLIETGINAGAYLVFGSDAAEQMAIAVNQHSLIQKVKLEGNSLGNEGCEAMTQVLERQESGTLVELGLVRNEIGDAGALTVARMLVPNRTVLKLDLQDNQIGDEGAAALASSLQRNTTLTEINLRANQLTSNVCAQLAAMLEANQSLTELNLRRNNLKDEGCELLAKALPRNSTLKNLHLSSNIIGDDGCIKLADALEKNVCLEEIYLDINLIKDPGCVRLAEALEKNGTLQMVDLKMNNFGGNAACRLADAVIKNTRLKTVAISTSLVASKEPANRISECLKGRPGSGVLKVLEGAPGCSGAVLSGSALRGELEVLEGAR